VTNSNAKRHHAIHISLNPKAGFYALLYTIIFAVGYCIFFLYTFLKFWDELATYGTTPAFQQFLPFIILGLGTLPLVCYYIYQWWLKRNFALIIHPDGIYFKKQKVVRISWNQITQFTPQRIDTYFLFIHFNRKWRFEVTLRDGKKLIIIANSNLHDKIMTQILEAYHSTRPVEEY
jgi:hypothetical protein